MSQTEQSAPLPQRIKFVRSFKEDKLPSDSTCGRLSTTDENCETDRKFTCPPLDISELCASKHLKSISADLKANARRSLTLYPLKVAWWLKSTRMEDAQAANDQTNSTMDPTNDNGIKSIPYPPTTTTATTTTTIKDSHSFQAITGHKLRPRFTKTTRQNSDTNRNENFYKDGASKHRHRLNFQKTPKSSPLTGYEAWAHNMIYRNMAINCKTLVIMRGFPGSGKSTLASKIVFSGQIFSADNYFIDLKTGMYNFHKNKLPDAHNITFCSVRTAMQQEINPVILDNTNTTMEEMYPYALLALAYGYFVTMLAPDTPWSMNANELERRNSHGVSLWAIKSMIRRYQSVVSPRNLIQYGLRRMVNIDTITMPDLRGILTRPPPNNESVGTPISNTHQLRHSSNVIRMPQCADRSQPGYSLQGTLYTDDGDCRGMGSKTPRHGNELRGNQHLRHQKYSCGINQSGFQNDRAGLRYTITPTKETPSETVEEVGNEGHMMVKSAGLHYVALNTCRRKQRARSVEGQMRTRVSSATLRRTSYDSLMMTFDVDQHTQENIYPRDTKVETLVSHTETLESSVATAKLTTPESTTVSELFVIMAKTSASNQKTEELDTCLTLASDREQFEDGGSLEQQETITNDVNGIINVTLNSAEELSRQKHTCLTGQHVSHNPVICSSKTQCEECRGKSVVVSNRRTNSVHYIKSHPPSAGCSVASDALGRDQKTIRMEETSSGLSSYDDSSEDVHVSAYSTYCFLSTPPSTSPTSKKNSETEEARPPDKVELLREADNDTKIDWLQESFPLIPKHHIQRTVELSRGNLKLAYRVISSNHYHPEFEPEADNGPSQASVETFAGERADNIHQNFVNIQCSETASSVQSNTFDSWHSSTGQTLLDNPNSSSKDIAMNAVCQPKNACNSSKQRRLSRGNCARSCSSRTLSSSIQAAHNTSDYDDYNNPSDTPLSSRQTRKDATLNLEIPASYVNKLEQLFGEIGFQATSGNYVLPMEVYQAKQLHTFIKRTLHGQRLQDKLVNQTQDDDDFFHFPHHQLSTFDNDGNPTYAAILKKSGLYETFYMLSDVIIESAFKAAGYNAKATKKHLIAVAKAKGYSQELAQNMITNSSSNSDQSDDEEQNNDGHRQTQSDNGEHGTSSQQSNLLKERAIQQAQNAYINRVPGAAHYYSENARRHAIECEEALQKEQQYVHEIHINSMRTTNVLDLHGFGVKAGLKLIKVALKKRQGELRTRVPGISQKVVVITGHGVHSPRGNAKLQPAVEKYLFNSPYNFRQSNSGVFKVTFPKSNGSWDTTM